MIFCAVMKYDSTIISSLFAAIFGWTLNLIASIIKANQQSLEYLFCIGLLIVGIRMMFRGVFKKASGGSTKK
jgi:hypothetical protein